MRLIKITVAAALLAIFFAGCNTTHEFKGTISFEPAQPKPGDDITVYYTPKGTPLDGVDNINMVACLYSVNLDDAVGVELKKEGEGYVGTFSTTPETRGVILKFVDKDNNETIDANNKEGYQLSLYGNDGKPVPGSEAGLAVAYYFWASNAGMDRDGNKALEAFDKAFTDNPDIKSEYLDLYFNLLVRTKPQQADSIMQKEIALLEGKKDYTEDELALLVHWYRNKKDETSVKKYSDLALQKYPKGDFAQKELFNKFDQTESLSDKLAQLKDFEKQFPESKIAYDMYDEIFFQYRKDNDYKSAYKFVKDNPNKVHPYYIYSLVEKMADDNVEPDLALKMAEEGVQQAEANINNPGRDKSPGQTAEEWDGLRKYFLAMNQFQYGKLLYNKGEKDKALKNLEDAIANITNKDYEDQDLYNLYGKVLVEQGQNEKAMEVISKYIENGNGSSELKEALKKAYTNAKGSEDGFEEYIDKFESAAEAEMLADLKKSMLDQPAPDFTLQDTDGKTVTLSGYKGKTVIVDFWATWCGPCKASFPAMQKAQEKYSTAKNTEFLFVNTWERVENKTDNAKQFIKEHNYPFHVLIDQENKAVTSYKVEGIPCKFIIGPDGKIKFKSVGYAGNEEELVKELGMMIDLTQK